MPVVTKIPIVVVYKKTKRSTAKHYMQVFHDIVIDDLLNERKTKPILPDTYEIVEIGMGESFEQRYKKKYKI
jgi:hypothetical protein